MAQNTVVTALITDPSGNPYKNCSFDVSLVNLTGSGTLVNISGSTFQTQFNGGSCDSTGTLVQPLFDSTVISPAGTQWKFNICDITGKTCFNYTTPACPTAGCITGASINISAAISAVAPSLATAGTAGTGTNNTFTGTNIFTGISTFANINKIVFAAGNGVKCDGITDDRAAIQASLDAGGKNSTVILPGSINPCLISVESTALLAYDGQWIQGAGKFATTIKRKSGGSAIQPLFLVANGGGFGTVGNVTFSDFTVDGNASGQTNGTANIQALTATSKFQFIRMRSINSWLHGLELATASGQNTDTLIADSDFESEGIVAATCVGVAQCQDIRIQHPLRTRISRNRSDSSQNFLVTVPSGTDGQMIIEENIVSNCLGFAVALGGVQIGSGITRNTFSCPASNQNIIDLANATDTVVSSNVITMGTANNGIADLPPALRVSATGNVIIGNVAGAATSSCISLGGSDIVIDGNVCRDAGGAGIVAAVPNTGASKNIVISNNTVKNCFRNNTGSPHAGIELFLQTGGTAALSGVVIQGNRSSDDAGAGGTQAYGIGLAAVGQVSGYSDINVMNNDVRGNKTGGILNSINPLTNVQIYANPGGESVATGSPTFGGGIFDNLNGGQQDVVVIKSGTSAAADIPSFLVSNQGNTALTRYGGDGNGIIHLSALTSFRLCPGQTGLPCPATSDLNVIAGSAQAKNLVANQGTACTNGELALSAGWGTTATVTAVAGTGQTCHWTITSSGTGQAANPTITDTLTNALPTATTVCDMRMEGGTGTNTLIQQTTLSATAPVFTFNGTPVSGSSYIVVRRCGP